MIGQIDLMRGDIASLHVELANAELEIEALRDAAAAEEEEEVEQTATPVKQYCDVDESKNALGPNQCTKNSECHGDRTCSFFGWCQGASNC